MSAAWLVVLPAHQTPVPFVDHGRAINYAAEHHGQIIALMREDVVAELIAEAVARMRMSLEWNHDATYPA